MLLSTLLEALGLPRVDGPDPTIERVTRDSREADASTAFCAIAGASVDGHAHVRGCGAAVSFVERPVEGGGLQVVVPDTRSALAHIAAALAGHPARDLQVVGVTGTNGKTTVTTLAEQMLAAAGVSAGRVGTTGGSVGERVVSTGFTTPEAHVLQPLLAEMVRAGQRVALLEVSSIGLAQGRVDALPFALGVFTNLTQDHLDFHGTMDAYRRAKALLFERLRPAGGAPRALLCADDDAHRAMGAPPDRWTYGFAADADLRIERAGIDAAGLSLQVATPMGQARFRSPLVGRHNALNLVAALGIGLALGIPLDALCDALPRAGGAPGRLEVVPNQAALLVLVDYAHSPDALAAALATARELTRGALWVVFGCGGDRDRGKRPLMGAAAEAGADHVVLTSDNPRSEDPDAILSAIAAGMRAAPTFADIDRAAAIQRALAAARPGDTVLIAGKGHETTQQVGERVLPFDDRAVARAALEAR